ncbi:precorrin-6A synthase (deacetylating) [Paraburkholderia acidicola]|uniref:Precorrin-6A synthase (Deacetylating) n=1 Tax=Paraburkholderia acidicola TaxID=1912599 RepID=A0A2A4F5N9_9BURK|nr:precorrin-6A synthase (deacetylating) [Paraburkholderia acidicola]PCE28012.1 precorrin-6A synthase (deacetylating) [Paraburkholderia acidicola]
MTKRILIIGIGAGDPDYMTVQAINALNQVDVFFVMDKGVAKEKLVALRKAIIERFVNGHDYRVVEATSPERRRDEGESDYRSAVDELNRDKQRVFERLISDELADGECGAFLVWGDPSLYDSTIRIVEAIEKTGNHAFDYAVIPGISSVQALAARHKVPLNQIGRSIQITNGRGIAEGFPNNVDSVVVMLDSQDTYRKLVDQNLDIYWGAYVGTPDEILISGKLHEVVDDIVRIRAEARHKHGWIMDTYLLRKTDGET